MGCKKDQRLCRCVGGRAYRSILEQINFKLKCELSLYMFLKDTWGCGHLPGDLAVHDTRGLLVTAIELSKVKSTPATAWSGARQRPRAAFISLGPHGSWLRKGPELK